MECFISGPVTGVVGYEANFAEAERLLTEQGHNVFNPARVFAGWIDYEAIMDACLKAVEKADVVCMLPGWQQSCGANREYGYALAKGIRIEKLYEEERTC